jgi:ElaB/YqjD/DUF883 family membrane-anchored ribosome-binding protein
MSEKKDEVLRDWLKELTSVTQDNIQVFRRPPLPNVRIVEDAYTELDDSIKKAESAVQAGSIAQTDFNSIIENAEKVREQAIEAANKTYEEEKTKAEIQLKEANTAVQETDVQRQATYQEVLINVVPFLDTLFNHYDLPRGMARSLFNFTQLNQELKNDIKAMSNISPELLQALEPRESISGQPYIARFRAMGASEVALPQSAESAPGSKHYQVQNKSVTLSWRVIPPGSPVDLVVGNDEETVQSEGTRDIILSDLPIRCKLIAFYLGGSVSETITLFSASPPAEYSITPPAAVVPIVSPPAVYPTAPSSPMSLTITPQRKQNVLAWEPSDPEQVYTVQVWFADFNPVSDAFNEQTPEWEEVTLIARTANSGIHQDERIKAGRKMRYRRGHLGAWGPTKEVTC